MSIGLIYRSKTPLFSSTQILNHLIKTTNRTITTIIKPIIITKTQYSKPTKIPFWTVYRHFHDGRPRGSLWRSKKMIGKEALYVIMGLKRVKEDTEQLDKFVKTHVSRLLKLDLIAVLLELERQQEVTLAVKIFKLMQKEEWYQPDPFLYKDLIISLAKCKEMDEVMQLWDMMRKEDLFPDSQTYTEVIRGFLKHGSPGDAMNIYEEMKQSPDPPEELPFRILLKGLLPHPLLRNKVKQDFEEIFPDSHAYDPPEEIFGLR